MTVEANIEGALLARVGSLVLSPTRRVAYETRAHARLVWI